MAEIFKVDEVELHDPFLVQYGDETQPVLAIKDFRDWPLRDKQTFFKGVEVSERYESLRKTGKLSNGMLSAADGIKIMQTVRSLGMAMSEDDRAIFDDFPDTVQRAIVKGFMAYTKANSDDTE